MLILGIESSCDDTSVALVEAGESGFIVLSEKTASQIEVHKKYGGVVPEIAGRKHAENILPVLEEVMKNQKQPDIIAVTSGPGLITGLLVGIEAAKSLSYLWNIPMVGVNHISGHIHSVLLNPDKVEANSTAPTNRGSSPSTDGVRGSSLQFPALCLIVSGGHTELILMKSHTEFELIGRTRDDAAGETFDKIGKLVGFDYPGGAKISQTAVGGNIKAIDLPRPMIKEGYEFSFAGLKTAVLYWLRDNAEKTETSYNFKNINLSDFCASFEQTIIDVLVTKTLRAVDQYKPQTVILSGGVSANNKLRETLEEGITKIFPNTKLLLPQRKYSMDNGAMIAVAGYFKAVQKDFTDWSKIDADPNWKVYK